MGNFCGSPKAMTCHPPRDLTSLLVEIQEPEDVDKCMWAKKFREFLKTQNPVHEAMLDFVIVCNVLRNKESELKQSRNSKLRISELNIERRELLESLRDSFFSENSDKPIPLSNQVLREELCIALSKIDDDCDEKILSQAYEFAWHARCDQKVWKKGLEDSYNKFISLNPSAPMTAVLLSIM